MTCPKPHYLLFCDGNVSANGENAGSQRGRWRFVLENLVSGERIEATDQEIACAPDRSALVAVLRGLEALEQPSRVTLVTTSRYVTRGLQYGLSEWRDNDYSWEHFGTVQPIRNADIWKRIDRALAYHQVQCRWMAQEGVAEPQDEVHVPSVASKSIEHDIEHDIEHAGDQRGTLVGKPANIATADRRTKGPSANKLRNSKSAEGREPSGFSTSDGLRRSAKTEAHLGMVPNLGGDRSGTMASIVESPQQPISKIRKRMPFFFLNLMLPVHLACRSIHLLCNHSWDAILAIDEWLESFLRCLFLLDPSKKPMRH